MRTARFLGATGAIASLLATSCAHDNAAQSAAQCPAAAGVTAAEPKATKQAPAQLPFIEDDYPRALAEAKAKNKLLFVDGWATWCHTCLSLKSYVLTAPEMNAEADKFVWLSLDSEKDQNAPYFEKFGLEALPTLWVIDPKSEQIAWKVVGALTAPELASDLDGLTGAKRSDADALLAQAARIDMQKDAAGAVRVYEKALAAAPQGWSRKADAVSGYVMALQWAKQDDRCADVAAREAASLPPTSSSVNVAVVGASCAQNAPQGSAGRAQLPALEKQLTAVTHLPTGAKAPILADDRSGAFQTLVESLKADGKKDLAKQAAGEWAGFLENEAIRAPDARGRAAFDAHRMLAYAELGDPARSIPMFQQTERDFPDDYNPAARLGRTFFDLKRYDEALDATSRAIGKAYGPRKLRLYQLKADIAEAKKDGALERKTLDEALSFATTVSLREGYEKLRVSLANRRAKLGPPQSGVKSGTATAQK